MFRRLATSRSVKSGLLAIALGFCVYALISQRSQAAAAFHHLGWGSVIGAVVAAVAGLGCQMLSWRTVVCDLGSPLSVRSATRVTFIAQLGKYVPGAVWATAAMPWSKVSVVMNQPRQNQSRSRPVTLLNVR